MGDDACHTFLSIYSLIICSVIIPAEAVEVAFGQQLGVAPLSEHFITADGDRVRKVQRASFVDHRYTHASVGIPDQHVLGDTARFFAEDDVRAVGVADLAVDVAGLGGEEEVIAAGGLFEEVVDGIVIGYVDKIPVVESGAFQIAVGYLEAERLHQMQPSSGCGAGAGDVAGVLRYLGLEKYYVYRLFIISSISFLIFQILSPLYYCN